MEFEFDNNTPIYMQLVNNIKMYIISGKLKSGERLPSVRELAFMLKVNPNTVQKALGSLEDIKLIYTERTNGKYVTDDIDLINKLKEEYILNLTRDYLSNLELIGLSSKDIIKYFKEERECNKWSY